MTEQEQPLTGRIPTVEVACANSGCSRHGITTWVRLTPAAVGFAVLPVLVCTRCGHHAVTVRPWRPGLVVVADTSPEETSTPTPVPAVARRGPGRPKKVR
jgi:hypothetical protein